MLLLGVLWWALAALEKGRSGRLAHFAEHALLERLATGHAPGLRRPLNLFVIAGVACLLLALAQPRWGGTDAGTRRGSREILVLLDTSESMNAVNPAPSRLARAQSKITALLEACSGDRFGLIAFSGSAVLQCPFTRDHAYFKTVLQSVNTDTLTEEGTDIVSALEEAERLFEDERGRGSGAARDDRMILLISDGESAQNEAAVVAERLAASSLIAVLGIGDPGGAEVVLPQWMARAQSAPVREVTHWSALNEDALTSIALAGGGVYVRSTLSGDDLDVILGEMAALDGIVGSEGGRPREVNRYRWPLALALFFFAAEGFWLVWMPRAARRAAQKRTNGEAVHAVV
jgi:Ca-activated chloride channel family protein